MSLDSDMDDKTPGKFRFRKPDSSKSSAKMSLTTSSASTKRAPVDRETEETRHKVQCITVDARSYRTLSSSASAAAVSQSRLLSFGGDDDEEDTCN